MNIIKDFKNNLLQRREVLAVIESNSNPGFEKVRENISLYFNVEKDLVVVKNLNSKFGSHLFEIDALIYDSSQDKEMIEPKPRKVKVKGGEAMVVNVEKSQAVVGEVK